MKKLYAWFVADTCCGEICTDLFCSFNLDLAVYFLQSNIHNKKYECLVLYKGEFFENIDKNYCANKWSYVIL